MTLNLNVYWKSLLWCNFLNIVQQRLSSHPQILAHWYWFSLLWSREVAEYWVFVIITSNNRVNIEVDLLKDLVLQLHVPELFFMRSWCLYNPRKHLKRDFGLWVEESCSNPGHCSVKWVPVVSSECKGPLYVRCLLLCLLHTVVPIHPFCKNHMMTCASA